MIVLDTCKHCGCTNDRACPGGCHWVKNGVCSACWDNQREELAELITNWRLRLAGHPGVIPPDKDFVSNLAGFACQVESREDYVTVTDHIGFQVLRFDASGLRLALNYDAEELRPIFKEATMTHEHPSQGGQCACPVCSPPAPAYPAMKEGCTIPEICGRGDYCVRLNVGSMCTADVPGVSDLMRGESPDDGVRRILDRIVGEMVGCDCDSHAVRFSKSDMHAAKAWLAAQEETDEEKAGAGALK